MRLPRAASQQSESLFHPGRCSARRKRLGKWQLWTICQGTKAEVRQDCLLWLSSATVDIQFWISKLSTEKKQWIVFPADFQCNSTVCFSDKNYKTYCRFCSGWWKVHKLGYWKQMQIFTRALFTSCCIQVRIIRFMSWEHMNASIKSYQLLLSLV